MRSTKTLSRQAPLPSMLIEIWLAIKTLVKASLVNWLPWSVLKIPGVPCFAKASSNASTQKVSAQRHAVSGSVPKARHRRFRCGRVPSRRTRLLVALERRGSGRLSDGERLHEPLGGRGEDLQNVETLLPRGRHDGPEERENPRALEGPEAAGDLHLDLHYPQILFGEVVGEGHVEVGEETQRFGFELLQPVEQIV